ncbi:Cof-type HAD-IIB family hydrolase [Paenibacillus sp. HJL G12]|uniref:Cof-type HAD-IIB family hydrolase n=1 Tax=Paenibacillus dendrobii TaxID=2691084 RepID=A0A7X3IHF2_9BACL|nr:Cof-type HAD-IIB family hydrolase [Paenibacillus dendrobii]MWV43366.1 Cof-type HAD-IIB family hydrolase [Paenibacillus dendrobii]
MKFPIIVLDLDGTLLNSNKQISNRNCKAIMECSALGMKFIFATARPPRAVKTFLTDELLNLGSFIYYNGAYINCKHTGIDDHVPIKSEVTSEVLDYCLKGNPDLDLSLEVKDEWMSLREYDYSTLMRVKGNPMVKSLEELKRLDASKILFSGNMDIISFQEKFKSQLNILITDNGNLVQVSSLKASKENAVAVLCKAMNIPLENVMVFGDDFNDIGLFKTCGWSVAMGNAIGELKEISKEITETNDNDGVAIILEKLCG